MHKILATDGPNNNLATDVVSNNNDTLCIKKHNASFISE